MYVLKHPDKFDTSNYYGFFAWKRELSFDEKIKRSAGYLPKQIQDLLKEFLAFEKGCLDLWNDFCAEYQNLPPERIQTAKKFCVLDSVTTPAAPSAPVEYVLYFAVRYGVCDERGELDGEVFLGPLSSPTGFRKALRKRMDLLEALKDSLIRNAPLISISSLEIIESEKYFAQYPEREFNTLNIPKITDFVREFNAGGSQAAPASGSFLVSPDPVPNDQRFIYDGVTTEIQDAVRDSKRVTTLTEQKKTNETLNESLGVQTEIRDLLKDGLEMIKPKELTDFEKKVMMFKEIEKRQGTEKARAEIWKTFGGSWKDVWAVEFPNDSLDNYHGKDRRKEAERTKNSIKKFYPEYTPNAETDE